jgi:hypothetical protein
LYSGLGPSSKNRESLERVKRQWLPSFLGTAYGTLKGADSYSKSCESSFVDVLQSISIDDVDHHRAALCMVFHDILPESLEQPNENLVMKRPLAVDEGKPWLDYFSIIVCQFHRQWQASLNEFVLEKNRLG